MYIIDDIAYAGELPKMPKVCGVRPLDNYKLWVRFDNGERRVIDISGLITSPAFTPLQDKEVFNSVYIDYGVTTWNDGNIDIDPEYIYEYGEHV